jgi:membrane-bound lytic murein transglycosylase D
MIPDEHHGSWRFHIAGQQDTADSIAQMFHVKASNLLAVNQLQPDDPIHAGEALIVPVAPPPATSAHMRYRARRGDTMITVADRFGVTTGQLRRWNRIRSNRLPVGRLLYVSEPVRSRHRSTRGRRRHSSASTRRASSALSRSAHHAKSRRSSTPRSIAAKPAARRHRKSAG